MTVSTTDSTFGSDVLGSELPVFVAFWREGLLGKLMSPIIDGLGKRVEGRARVYRLSVNENPRTARRYGINGSPKVLLFSKGKIKREFEGMRPAGVYLNALSRLN